MNKFKKIFGNTKPLIAMLHLKHDSKTSMIERAKKEIEIYYSNGIEAVLVENYFGSTIDCEQVLSYLQDTYPNKIYGVNILGYYKTAFALAEKYGAKFIQIDSVCGHLKPTQDEQYASELNSLRENSNAAVLGGVRFKYQAVNSGRSTKEDLELGKQRCDAIVVTGNGTGLLTPKEKIDEFRTHLGGFPLIVGAGVTIESLNQSLESSDGIIVGSRLKEGHKDFGDVSKQNVKDFVAERNSRGI